MGKDCKRGAGGCKSRRFHLCQNVVASQLPHTRKKDEIPFALALSHR